MRNSLQQPGAGKRIYYWVLPLTAAGAAVVGALNRWLPLDASHSWVSMLILWVFLVGVELIVVAVLARTLWARLASARRAGGTLCEKCGAVLAADCQVCGKCGRPAECSVLNSQWSKWEGAMWRFQRSAVFNPFASVFVVAGWLIVDLVKSSPRMMPRYCRRISGYFVIALIAGLLLCPWIISRPEIESWWRGVMMQTRIPLTISFGVMYIWLIVGSFFYYYKCARIGALARDATKVGKQPCEHCLYWLSREQETCPECGASVTWEDTEVAWYVWKKCFGIKESATEHESVGPAETGPQTCS